MIDANIVYVNYYLKDELLVSLSSLMDDNSDCQYSVRVTVVDNSCNEEGLEEILKDEFPSVDYINPGENLGFGSANNMGFRRTSARYYIALNCDTVIPEGADAVKRLIAFMDGHPEVGCAGPKLLNMDGSLQYSCFRYDLFSILVKPFRQFRTFRKSGVVQKYVNRLMMKGFDHQETRPVDWVSGAYMIMRGEVAEGVGIFDEDYFLYFEDTDLCHRMWYEGWSVYYIHDIFIRHQKRRESAKVSGILSGLINNRTVRMHIRSWMRYMIKWWGKHRSYSHLSK
jgi:hypothetical protein